ncbi:MAG: hypothetical protein AMXMBFR72_37380 [Betaproteobacteria bacterium]
MTGRSARCRDNDAPSPVRRLYTALNSYHRTRRHAMRAGIAYPTLSPAELARRWNELQRERSAPDFCELDEYGDVIATSRPSKPH